MNKRIYYILLFSLLLFTAGRAGKFRNVGNSGANFLQIPVEARGAAMAGAYVALSEGAEGLYWNPASIGYIRGVEAIVSNVDWIMDTKLLFAGVAKNFGNLGSFGFSATSLTMDEMEITTELQPDGTGEYFDAGDMAFAFSYARSLTDRFTFGITAKYIYEYIWDASSSSIGFDFSSLYRTDFHHLRIGMILSNFGSNMKMSGDPIDDKLEEEKALDELRNPREERLAEEYSIPQLFNVGIAFDPVHNEFHRITLSSMANDPNDNKTRISFGSEYAYRKMFSIRAGYKANYDEESISLGLGANLNISGFKTRFDYAFSDFGDLGSIHYFTFSVRY